MLETCKLLVNTGINSVEYEESYSDFVLILQQVLNVPVILTGGHHEYDKLNLPLNEYSVEYFGMSRPLIREKNLLNHWKEENTRKVACGSTQKKQIRKKIFCPVFNVRKYIIFDKNMIYFLYYSVFLY